MTSAYPNFQNPTEGLFRGQHVLALAQAGIKGTVVVCKRWLSDRLAKRWKRYRPLAYLPRYEEHHVIPVLYSRCIHFLVNPNNVEDLTAGLSNLLKNNEYASVLGRASKARARDFTWERNAAQYLDVYKKVCGDWLVRGSS